MSGIATFEICIVLLFFGLGEYCHVQDCEVNVKCANEFMKNLIKNK
jgi:hypothetical protein